MSSISNNSSKESLVDTTNINTEEAFMIGLNGEAKKAGEPVQKIQPWKAVMEKAAAVNEEDADKDLFPCSAGFYAQSVAG